MVPKARRREEAPEAVPLPLSSCSLTHSRHPRVLLVEPARVIDHPAEQCSVFLSMRRPWRGDGGVSPAACHRARWPPAPRTCRPSGPPRIVYSAYNAPVCSRFVCACVRRRRRRWHERAPSQRSDGVPRQTFFVRSTFFREGFFGTSTGELAERVVRRARWTSGSLAWLLRCFKVWRLPRRNGSEMMISTAFEMTYGTMWLGLGDADS